MKFCELAHFMHHHYVESMTSGDFVKVLFDAIFDESELDRDEFNPLYKLSRPTLESYYNGRRKISQKIASSITPRISEVTFSDFVDQYSVDALTYMADELVDYGFDVKVDEVGTAIADIFSQMIRKRAQGFSDDVTSLSYKRVQSAKRLKDVDPASIERRGDKLHVAGEVISLYPFKMTEESMEQELGYIRALYEVYAEKLGKEKFTFEDAVSLPKNIAENHKEQREAYCRALTVERSVRDIFDDGDDEFELLKDDAWHGINTTYWQQFPDGYARLNAVLEKITNTTLNGSVLSQMKGLINNIEKKGICHILVNDGVITSWVEPVE